MGVVRDALSVFCTLAPAMPVRAPVRASGGLSTLAYALMPPSTFEAVKTRFSVPLVLGRSVGGQSVPTLT